MLKAAPMAWAKRLGGPGTYADFSLDWALKDLDLVAAEAPGAAPVAGTIAERWRNLVRSGWSGSDVSAARNGLG